MIPNLIKVAVRRSEDLHAKPAGRRETSRREAMFTDIYTGTVVAAFLILVANLAVAVAISLSGA